MAPMVTLPKAPELAQIRSLDGDGYQLTRHDAELALRMAVFEGGDPAMTLWTLAQRWVLFSGRLRKRGSKYGKGFGDLIQEFSQPLNPAWLASGTFCRPGGKYAGTAYCTPEKLARRSEAQNSPLEAVQAKDPAAFETALAWLRAEVPNPVPRGTNFSVPHVAEFYMRRTPGARELVRTPADACPACNVILSEPDAANWPRNFVRLEVAGKIADAAAASGAGESFTRGVLNALTRWWAG